MAAPLFSLPPPPCPSTGCSGCAPTLTNTFQANPFAMQRLGLRCADGCWIAASTVIAPLSRERGSFHGAKRELYILADVGPIIDTKTNEEFTDLAYLEERPWRHLDDVIQPDAVVLETCSTPGALEAARVVSTAEVVLLSLAYKHDPAKGLVTHSGHTPEWFARRARDSGIAALGVNCGRDVSLADCAEIIRRYRAETDLPLFARPNAGTPAKTAAGWVYPQTVDMMAKQLPELLAAGVSMVGGCCGTTPAHIAAFRQIVDAWNRRK